jgi:hypothetical protein
MSGEAQIRAAIAEADRVLAGGQTSPYPRELFPELERREQRRRGPSTFAAATAEAPAQPTVARPVVAPHARPVTPAAEAELTPETVASWSAELGFATSMPRAGRITRAND